MFCGFMATAAIAQQNNRNNKKYVWIIQYGYDYETNDLTIKYVTANKELARKKITEYTKLCIKENYEAEDPDDRICFSKKEIDDYINDMLEGKTKNHYDDEWGNSALMRVTRTILEE